MGFINQLITGGHHLVETPQFQEAHVPRILRSILFQGTYRESGNHCKVGCFVSWSMLINSDDVAKNIS